METSRTKSMQNPPLKCHKYMLGVQILLRILGIVFTLAATCTILTSKQSITVFGIDLEARYSYSPTMKFFAFANIIGCAFSGLSLLLAFVFGYKGLDPKNFFYVFLHDLVVMALLLAGSSAATGIGYIGKNGESHAGWMPICDHVTKFCDKVRDSVILSYFGVISYFILTIISVNQCRQIQL